MSKRPRHLGMHHIALSVSDIDAVCHFWVALLGYQIEWRADADNIYLTSGTDNVALHRARSGAPSQASSGHDSRLDHLGIIVATADDVHAWEAYLDAAHVPIVARTKLHRDGATSCYVRCPSGLVVQILHHPPISPRLAQHEAPPEAGR